MLVNIICSIYSIKVQLKQMIQLKFKSLDDFGASDVIGTLLDEFLRAARYEYLPSPSYWKTLTIACRRWKHQVFKILYYKIKYLSKFVSLYGQLF